MLKLLYKIAFFALFVLLCLQNSIAQCPSNSSTIVGDTVCSTNTSAPIVIHNAKVGAKYVFYLGKEAIDSAIATTTSFSRIIPLSKLFIGKNELSIKAFYTGCPTTELLKKATVLVNHQPETNQFVIGDTICASALSAKIRIYGSWPGEKYHVTLNNGGSKSISQTDTVSLYIMRSLLSLGANKISIHSSAEGCSEVVLQNQAIILVNPQVVVESYSVTGETICSSNPNAKITISPSSKLVKYQMYFDNMAFLDSFYGDSTKNFTVKNIPTLLLNPLENQVTKKTITVKANIYTGTCGGIVTLQSDGIIFINPTPKPPSLELRGDTVTLPESFATITVINPIVGVKYMATESINQLKDSITSSTSNPIKLYIPVGESKGLSVGTHTVTVKAVIFGCTSQTLIETALIVVKPAITTSTDQDFATTNFNVWPNPFSSEIHITSEKLKGLLKIQIKDAIGNIVHQESVSNTQDLKLNPDLKSGIYFLQMESEGSKETVKLIKQ